MLQSTLLIKISSSKFTYLSIEELRVLGPHQSLGLPCTSFMISLFKSPMRWAKYPTQPFLSNLFALMAKMRQDWRTLHSPQNTTLGCPELLSTTSFRNNPPIHGVPPTNPFPRRYQGRPSSIGSNQHATLHQLIGHHNP